MTSRYLTFVAVLTASLALLAPSAGARPGDIDPSFAGSGTTTLPLGAINGFANVTALQPDGKLIVAGHEQTLPDPSCIVARYLPNGTLDPSFGAPGTHYFEYTATDNCRLTSIAVRPDGRILLGGKIDPSGANNAEAAVFGLTPGGLLDNGWSGDGIYRESYLSGSQSVTDISLLPSGRLLAISSTDLANAGVVTGIKSDGTLDTAFAMAGRGIVGTGYKTELHGLVDGRYVVGGKFIDSGNETFRISRVGASGTIFDSAFGVSGHATTTASGDDSGFDDLLVQPDGKYIIVGSGYVGGKYRGVLVRYSSEGQLDTSFGSGGVVYGSFRAHDYFTAAALTPSGKIMAVGESSTDVGSSTTDPLAVRFNADGSLDSGFGTAGAVYNFFGPFHGTATSVAVGSDEKISAIGTSEVAMNDYRIAATRLIGVDPIVTPLTTTISSPSKKKLKAKKFTKFAGTASGDGLSKVEISVLKSDSKLLKKKKRCLHLSSNRAKFKKYKAVKKKCVPTKWLTATGTNSWTYKLKKALKPGKYTLYVRALNTLGVAQSTPTKKSFTLTK